MEGRPGRSASRGTRPPPRQSVGAQAGSRAPQATLVGGVSVGQNQFSFDPTAGPAYMLHCHILDHEDNEMMRPYMPVR